MRLFLLLFVFITAQEAFAQSFGKPVKDGYQMFDINITAPVATNSPAEDKKHMNEYCNAYIKDFEAQFLASAQMKKTESPFEGFCKRAATSVEGVPNFNIDRGIANVERRANEIASLAVSKKMISLMSELDLLRAKIDGDKKTAEPKIEAPKNLFEKIGLKPAMAVIIESVLVLVSLIMSAAALVLIRQR